MVEKKIAAEAANIKGVLEYIQEREGNLARATEKLRRNVERIANVFGDKKLCQICGKDKFHGNHFRYYDRGYHLGFDEMPEKVMGYKAKLVTPEFNPSSWGDPEHRIIYIEEHISHKFLPKVYVSIEIRDDEPFFVDDEKEYFLVMGPAGMRVEIDNNGSKKVVGVEDISRRAIKALVKSGRISKFLGIVAEKLEKASEEYQDVAEVAERLAVSLP